MYSLVNNSYNRRRKNNYILRLLIITFLILFIITTYVYKISGNKMIEYREITVEDGDSLWNIALKHSDGSNDLREIVYEIKKFNNLKDVVLQPGQKLKIPVKI